MKSRLLAIAFLLVSVRAFAQVSGLIEQIYYYGEQGEFFMGPVVQLQNKNNWYAEARYNYEDHKTLSFYIGRVYAREAKFSYSAVPIFGGVVGRYKGGSAGLNVEMDYEGFFFAAQSQYTFSVEDEIDNFYFSWSELGYQPLDWLYGGLAMQLTHYPQTGESIVAPGMTVGFTYKKWTLPVFVFNPLRENMNFVCSIIWEW